MKKLTFNDFLDSINFSNNKLNDFWTLGNATSLSEDTGGQKSFLIASPEKALCDMTAMQTHISTKREMKEFLELMRLDDSVSKNFDLSLLEEIKTGYRRQSIRLLLNCLKEDYV